MQMLLVLDHKPLKKLHLLIGLLRALCNLTLVGLCCNLVIYEITLQTEKEIRDCLGSAAYLFCRWSVVLMG